MKVKRRDLLLAAALFVAFVMWTIAVQCIDVQEIGPMGSAVGLSTINQFVHKLTGVHLQLYVLTDWLGLVPVAVCFAFGVTGLVQWIQRKHILNVDFSILILGVYYLITIAAYLLFEYVVINYRPILIEGRLEVSYPSSTTLLVLCVMPTALMQMRSRIKNILFKNAVQLLICSFIVFMVAGRLISGVHWLSDIVGGILLSGSLVFLYRGIVNTRK